MSNCAWAVLAFFSGLGITVISDMVSEEVRDRLDHIPHAILKVAARRLDPADVPPSTTMNGCLSSATSSEAMKPGPSPGSSPERITLSASSSQPAGLPATFTAPQSASLLPWKQLATAC